MVLELFYFIPDKSNNYKKKKKLRITSLTLINKLFVYELSMCKTIGLKFV